MEFTPPLTIETRCSPDRSASMHGWDQLAEFAPLGSVPARQVPPQAQALANGAARLLAETLTGHRNARQLGQWLSAEACDRLMTWTRQHRGSRISLDRINLTEISPGRVEGQLHFDFGTGRLCATLCLTMRAGRWTCRHLNILLPGADPHC